MHASCWAELRNIVSGHSCKILVTAQIINNGDMSVVCIYIPTGVVRTGRDYSSRALILCGLGDLSVKMR